MGLKDSTNRWIVKIADSFSWSWSLDFVSRREIICHFPLHSGAGMFEEARQRAEKHVIDEGTRKAESRRPISPTVERMLNEVNEPHDSMLALWIVFSSDHVLMSWWMSFKFNLARISISYLYLVRFFPPVTSFNSAMESAEKDKDKKIAELQQIIRAQQDEIARLRAAVSASEIPASPMGISQVGWGRI